MSAAGKMDLGTLWREAEQYGEIYMVTGVSISGAYQATATITRAVGKSQLKTSFHRDPFPERALFMAIEEARGWGLVAVAMPTEREALN